VWVWVGACSARTHSADRAAVSASGKLCTHGNERQAGRQASKQCDGLRKCSISLVIARPRPCTRCCTRLQSRISAQTFPCCACFVLMPCWGTDALPVLTYAGQERKDRKRKGNLATSAQVEQVSVDSSPASCTASIYFHKSTLALTYESYDMTTCAQVEQVSVDSSPASHTVCFGPLSFICSPYSLAASPPGPGEYELVVEHVLEVKLVAHT